MIKLIYNTIVWFTIGLTLYVLIILKETELAANILLPVVIFDMIFKKSGPF